MKCPNIEGLQFSAASARSLKHIKDVSESAKALSLALGFGNVANIFIGGNALTATYSIYSTDFLSMSRAMQNVPAIERERIELIAGLAFNKVTNYKEKRFWKALYLGCKK